AVVLKLNAQGSGLIYSTYLGGPGFPSPFGHDNRDDYGYAIAVDSSGNAYVAGSTGGGFPTQNALQATYGGGTDAFVAKINAAGSALVYSTYLGGTSFDSAYGIAVDSAGNAYVTGITYSLDFPTQNPVRARSGGAFDAFVA